MLEKNKKTKPVKKTTVKKDTLGNNKTTKATPRSERDNTNLFLNVNYGLMIFFPVVGILMAFVLAGRLREDWVQTHLKYIIQTVIYGLIAFFVGFFIMYYVTWAFFYVVGFALIILTLIWYYLRMIGGWITFNQGRPIEGHFGLRYNR